MSTLGPLLTGGAFQGYAYAYPHKTAYRPLLPTRPLDEVWAQEDKSALFLYVHIPFCEMRCGFCNLFTSTHPQEGLVTRYLQALEQQGRVVAEALGEDAGVSRIAIGGGTPTYLEVDELTRLCDGIEQWFPGALGNVPTACEVSPATATDDRLALLKSRGFTRISMGVQSFVEAETRELGRPQHAMDAHRALDRIRSHAFHTRNVDLIYGMRGQTRESWKFTLESALQHEPEEVYLYPLYVRPLTGMERLHRIPDDDRLERYREGRDFLLSHGYRQLSMRLFRKMSHESAEGPVYCCQEDGMVGLGVGARSYTTALHYCTEYAVGRTGVREITQAFVERPPQEHAVADFGCELDESEQRRRYVIKSLLRADGLDLMAYESRFSSSAMEDFPELEELVVRELAGPCGMTLQLNEQGMELSDVIGPWMISDLVHERMDAYQLR